MDNELQTSFIPKKPAVDERTSKVRSTNIFSFLATIIFFASIITAGGLYFYSGILTSQITDMEQSLDKSKSAFEPSLIANLQSLDKKLSSAKEILLNHVTVSPIFKSLEELTLKSIRFTKFTYAFMNDTVPASPKASPAGSKIQVKMSGQTLRGYTPIALESNKLSENKYIKDIVFSNLTLLPSGGVSFDLDFNIDSNFILFEKNVNQSAI